MGNMKECGRSAKKGRSNSAENLGNENDNNQMKNKNKKQNKNIIKKNSKNSLKSISNEKSNGGEKMDIPQEDKDFEIKDEKNKAKSPEKEVIGEYESERPSIKIVEKKTINNSTILIGLANIGATCYMNATLQCLSNTDKLTNYFLKEFEYDKDKVDDTKKISNQYYRLLHHLWSKTSDKKDYAPKHFKKVLSEVNPLFSGVNANDSKDLLNFLLETLHRELNKAPKEEKEYNNIGNNINQFSEEDIKQIFFKDFAKRYRSIISDLFYFTFEIKSQCCNCKLIKYNFQVNPFLEFPLEQVNQYLFQNGKIASLTNMDGSNPDINLHDCFEYNQKIDLMSGENQMYCNLCNNCYDSYYSTTLYLSPEILIINLNRGKNAVYQCNVNFPEELDLTNYVINKDYNTQYELYAVICHIGPSSMSGHFVAYCRNRMDDKWYLYNDSIVTLCEKPKEYLNKMPYILFYKSKNLYKNNNENNINQNNLINQNQNIINGNNNIIVNNNMNNNMINNMNIGMNMNINNNMNYNMNNAQANNINMMNMNNNLNNNMNNGMNNNIININMNNNINNNMNNMNTNNYMNNANGINNINNMNINNNINNFNDMNNNNLMNNTNGMNNNNSMNNSNGLNNNNGMNNMNCMNNNNCMNNMNCMNNSNGMNNNNSMNNSNGMNNNNGMNNINCMNNNNVINNMNGMNNINYMNNKGMNYNNGMNNMDSNGMNGKNKMNNNNMMANNIQKY